MSKFRILGNFYTNNKVHPKILQSSLDTIESAAFYAQCRGDIDIDLSICSWEPVNRPKFKSVLTYYHIPTHFGIYLQILRNYAELDHPVDLICFLEHDVLYPADYFVRVAAVFSTDMSVDVISNMDYIGMNQTGWLDVTCRQEPMHQMSMKASLFEDQISTRVLDFVTNRNILLEPEQSKFKYLRIPYKGEAPSVHMNHSRHFTSHYNCYENNSNGKVEHPYWGRYSKYYPVDERAANT